MFAPSLILLIGSGYLLLLFLIAYLTDKAEAAGRAGFIASPVVYTLSLAVYCTSWTFYGAVGSAARNGLEYITIYLGPTLVFMAWWILLRKLVRITRDQQITSIADFISARYGKSASLSALVTVIAIVGITPYIALQLKAIATSFQALSRSDTAIAGVLELGIFADNGFWVAVALAAFVILFGTRNLGADESHPGVVAAIAFESIVKLLALLAVGISVILGLGEGFGAFRDAGWNDAVQRLYSFPEGYEARWIAITFLAAAAIVCLPRQFQVAIVENRDERQLATAAWLFPLYLLLICLFVIPIALAGLTNLPETANPDLFVLSLPLEAGNEAVAIFAFIGGLSAATSMVIVASIALSIMISNHLVTPLLLRANLLHGDSRGGRGDRQGDIAATLLTIRRISIAAILALGFLYYRESAASDALASIGLISFVGVAQFLPALIGGIFWRNATKTGAFSGLSLGFAVWLYCLMMPTFAPAWGLDALLREGPWGLAVFRPTALFGSVGWDPLVHAVFWSLLLNTAVYLGVSAVTRQTPIERLQSALFVDVFTRGSRAALPALPRSASVEDLFALARAVLGPVRAHGLFEEQAQRQGRSGQSPLPTPQFIGFVERQLAGGIGAASARQMVSRIAKGEARSIDTVMALSEELRQTAEQLRAANEKLTQLDQMKDDFLSHVSHELRTPMTSIRSFSEFLNDQPDLDPERARRCIDIIFRESERLTRLLDEILDLGRMEHDRMEWNLERVDAGQILSDAAATMAGLAERDGVVLTIERPASALVEVDPDRLKQVFLNLLSNAVKFNTSERPTVLGSLRTLDQQVEIRVEDNGPGVSEGERGRLFTKFGRGWRDRAGRAKGSGLGLAICAQILRSFGGSIVLERSGPKGSVFCVTLPLTQAETPILRAKC
ncbi:MAG: sodium:solute symporter [Rhodospirillales bacterium]|nr:sodium:solute symporter [Rhodospirillales bacterium]